MSCCQGSRPSLRTQTYLQWICWAACAVRLSPLRAASTFPAEGGGWWKDRGRKREWRGRQRGGERGEVEAGWVGRGLNVKLPLQRPAKSLSYMENTSCLQGNRTTSEFLQTKIALMSGDDLCSLALVALSASVTFKFPHEDGAHVRQNDFICRGLEETT